MDGRVGYLGPPGSYTHQAAISYTKRPRNSEKNDEEVELVPLSTIAAVFEAVQKGQVYTGVVPIENSTNGAVYPTLDLFASQVTQVSTGEDAGAVYEVGAVGEEFVRVEHYLLAYPTNSTSTASPPLQSEKSEESSNASLKTIKAIHTHPQAWTQCSHFLSNLPPQVERLDASSTSRAAEIAAADTTGCTAAIASRAAGELFGLAVLEAGIQDRGDNVTRFLVLRRSTSSRIAVNVNNEARSNRSLGLDDQSHGSESHSNDEESQLNQNPNKKDTKSLIAFTIAHTQPGALASALNAFNKAGLNLSSINTRPSGLEAWGYVFFVEVLTAAAPRELRANGLDRRLEEALRELEGVTGLCCWLGSWERVDVPFS